MRAPVKTVVLTPPPDMPEVDPNLLLLDGRDIRSVNRHERRAHGFSGPAFTQPSPTLPRFVRRHAEDVMGEASGPRTRRSRKRIARIKRQVARRGLS